MLDRKLRQLHSTFVCGENLNESGIEDLGSSADSSPDVSCFPVLSSNIDFRGFFILPMF